MNLRTLMQVGPAKANELFARLAETSDGAVKTREKLFAELKGELELHTSLEEQHLFPVLRRNAETKELVADAVRDNRELRAKLAELEALPKNDPAFPEQFKELHHRNEAHVRKHSRAHSGSGNHVRGPDGARHWRGRTGHHPCCNHPCTHWYDPWKRQGRHH